MIKKQMKNLSINLAKNSYDITFGYNLLDDAGDILSNHFNGNKVAIITDEIVDSFYGAKVLNAVNKKGFTVKKIVIPKGEQSKSQEMLNRIYDELLDFSITRGDLIVALGGGVVGDLTGYAAATLLRGIPFIQIPTTLLAQVDSSIGGKVAINVRQGKNLIGAFYHPKHVIIDLACLHTLSDLDFSSGIAEVLKYGLIADKALFEMLCHHSTRVELEEKILDIVYRCCEIKKSVVEEDELDKGLRMTLNFGHTFGHLYEKAYGYEKYTHGQAVAAGMCKALEIGEKLGLTKEDIRPMLEKVLVSYKLPTKIKLPQDFDAMQAIGLDKKNHGDSLSLVLIKDIGTSFLYKVSKKNLDEIVRNVL